jgi:hypothetical protein
MRWNALRETVGTSVMVVAIVLSLATSAIASGWPGRALLGAAVANALVGANALLRRRSPRRARVRIPGSTAP